MAGKAGALAARLDANRTPDPFDADERTKVRQAAPVIIAGETYNRRRKDWDTSRAMREVMRAQEKHVATSTRIRRRIAELEVDQIEAAASGDDEKETELEATIEALVLKADEATEHAELASYRIVELLLVPASGDRAGEPLTENELVDTLKSAMDVEDVAALARELTGSDEPDPQETPPSDDGSS